MKVTGNVSFSMDFTAEGRIEISRSTIGGNLNCSGAKIQSRRQPEPLNTPSAEIIALDATSAKIDGNVLLGTYVEEHSGFSDIIHFQVDGILRFFAANIGGALELTGTESLGKAIIDLRDAKARVLSNPENSWPKSKNLRLQGFMFNELGGPASQDAKTQIKWLRLQEPFVAQPYEQMATVFLNMGYQEEGVDISIAEIGMQDG